MKLTILPRYLVEARTGLILGTHLLHEEFHKILNTVKLAIDSRACTVELLLIPLWWRLSTTCLQHSNQQ